MHLIRVRASDAWSFPSEHPLEFDFDRHLTVIIGQNNSGKSNVLRPVRQLAEMERGGEGFGRSQLQQSDLFQNQDPKRPSRASLEVILSLNRDDLESAWSVRPREEAVLNDVPPPHFIFNTKQPDGIAGSLGMTWELGFDSSHHSSHNLSPDFKNATHAAVQLKTLSVHSWRRLSEKTSRKKTFLEALQAAHGPGSSDREHARHWTRFTNLFRTLAGMADVEVVPSTSRGTVALKRGEVFLDISNYGDGIQHLLMIAFEASRGNRGVLIIEEPETGLHPRLQRQLLGVLRDAQSELGDDANQIIITTHSPALLDQGAAPKVVRVVHDGTKSVVATARTSHEMYTLLDDLGVLASDLLQTNLAIWVEGPSDRTFLRKALALVDPDHKEGVHFQFVFYGGALRAHYTVGGDTESLVDVLRLSRNVVFVMDRDTADANAELDRNKQRVVEECQKLGQTAWVTAGREIENYLSDRVVRQAVWGNVSDPPKLAFGPFDDFAKALSTKLEALGPGTGLFRRYDANKAKAMHAFVDCMKESDLSVLDLKAKLTEIKDAIARANR